VQDTDDIVYSKKYNLSLHLFQPPKSDTRTKRPALVAIHGGGFKGGTRNDKKGLIDWCYKLATMGYVTVSIDYRLLGSDKTNISHLENSNLIAMYDAKAAVRWLRKNAAMLRIDPEKIAAFGSSAGAMTTAFLAGVSDKGEGDSGNPGFSSDISAGVSLSGALIYLNYDDAKKGAVKPFLDFHGCSDHTVPYSCVDYPGGPDNCWGSGVDTVAQWKKKSAIADIYSFPGAGHVPWGDLAASPAADSMVGFLSQHLDLSSSQCP
jgi:dienelactone hydrolase